MIRKLLVAISFALFSFIAPTGSVLAAELNKATQAELESVSGIGPSMSARILEERKKGDFKSWADFSARIKGIGQKKATKFSQAGLTVNGAGFDGTSIAAAGGSKGARPAKKSASAGGSNDHAEGGQVKITKSKS